MDKTVTEVNDEDQAVLDFDSGFKAETASEVALVADKKNAVVPAPEHKVEEPAPVVPTPAPEEPKAEYVQITKAQFEELQGTIKRVATTEQTLNKLNGSLGNIFQIVQKLQSETPKGEAIEVTDETVAELTEDYPQLATAMKAILAKALKGRVGTGTAEPAKVAPVAPVVVPTVDTETVRKLVKDDGGAREIKALTEDHPQWREIVGIVDSEGKYDPKNEYRIWLAKQPAAYQAQINGASTALVISKSIDKFQADKAKKVPAPIPPKNKQRDRIADAVTPKGDGSPPPPTNTADEDFNAGFRTG